MANIFVTPTGDDSTGNGTTEPTAYRTPGRALGAANSGDVIRLKVGDYPFTSATVASPGNPSPGPLNTTGNFSVSIRGYENTINDDCPSGVYPEIRANGNAASYGYMGFFAQNDPHKVCIENVKWNTESDGCRIINGHSVARTHLQRCHFVSNTWHDVLAYLSVADSFVEHSVSGDAVLSANALRVVVKKTSASSSTCFRLGSSQGCVAFFTQASATHYGYRRNANWECVAHNAGIGFRSESAYGLTATVRCLAHNCTVGYEMDPNGLDRLVDCAAYNCATLVSGTGYESEVYTFASDPLENAAAFDFLLTLAAAKIGLRHPAMNAALPYGAAIIPPSYTAADLAAAFWTHANRTLT